MRAAARHVGLGLLVAATFACGRLGFDATTDGATTDGAADAASQPILLASGQGPLRGIVVDATHVYWTGTGGIKRVVKTGGTPEIVATFSGTGFRMVEVDGYLYTVTRDSGVVARAAKTSAGAPAEIVDTGGGDLGGIDSDGTTVYWDDYPLGGQIFAKPIGGARTALLPAPVDELTDIVLRGTTLYYLIDQGGLWRIDVAGGAPVEVVPGVGSWEVAIDGDDAFVANLARDRILRCSLSGTAPPAEVGVADEPWGIAVDATHVYFGNEAGDTVARAPRTGGATEVLAMSSAPVGVAVDADAVYWTTYQAGEVWKLAK